MTSKSLFSPKEKFSFKYTGWRIVSVVHPDVYSVSLPSAHQVDKEKKRTSYHETHHHHHHPSSSFFYDPSFRTEKKKQFLLFLILDAISFFGEGLVFIHRKTVASSCALFFLLISTHHASKLTRLLTSASGNKKKKLKLLIFILPRRDITNSFRLSFLIIYTLAVSESCMGHHSPSRVFSIPLYWCAQFASVVSFAMMISCASALFRRTHHSNKTKNEREKSYWNVGQVFAALRRRFSLSKFCHCRRGRSIQRTRPVSSECHSTLAVAWISTNLFPPHSGR